MLLVELFMLFGKFIVHDFVYTTKP